MSVYLQSYVPDCHLWISGSTIFFPHYLMYGTNFEKKTYWIYNVYSALLYNFCLKHSRSKTNWVRYNHKFTPLFLSDFNEAWIFSTNFRKNTHISIFTKILPVGAELFRADGWTDMTLIDAFRNFANARKKKSSIWRAGSPTDIRTGYLEEEFRLLPLPEPSKPERK
jgi:hypothetical protein